MRVLTTFVLFTASLLAADATLIKSVDTGRTWTDSDPVSTDRFLWSLAIDARNSTLYALTQRELGEAWCLSVSIDGGQTWQIRQSFPREIYWISASVSDTPDTLYLAYEFDGYPRRNVMIAKVTDRGESMEQYRAEGLVVLKGGFSYDVLATLKADPRAPAKLYALVTRDPGNDEIYALMQGLWASGDGGRNWERLNPPVADGCLYPEVQIDPSDSSVYVMCGNDLFKSTDGGGSWTAKPFPDGQRLWNLQIGPGARAILFANRLGVIWKSIDGSETWQRFGALPAGSDPRFLTPHPVNPSLLYASTRDGVVKSEDDGVSWTPVTEYSLQTEYPSRLLIDPQAPDTFYLVNWMRQQVHLGQ